MSKPKSLFWGSVLLMALPMLVFGQKASKIPMISSLSPNSATAGSGNIIMTVNGSSFTSGTTVQWNGTGLTTTYVSSTQLQASVPMSLTASAGTASVTAVTSGKFGGTSNILSFTIAAPAPTTTTTTTTTTTSTTPLSITTSSVPSATAGTSYNTSFAGSGGTPAYVWSIPSGGGTLPPGLILATTGTLTGTPSTAGTYSFTVQAADSAATQQTAQKVFSMSVAAPPTTTTTTTSSSANILFQDDFESGCAGVSCTVTTSPSAYLPKWGGVTTSTVTTIPPVVQQGVKRSGNYALQFHYVVCGDSTDPNCGASSQDINRWVSKVISPGLTHFFMRGYVYFKSPEPDATVTGNAQRKVMWFSDSTSPANSQVDYANFLNSWTALGRSTLSLAFGGNNVASCAAGANTYIWDMAYLNWDTWYSIEVEIQLNTPGASDGILRLWVNGTQAYSNTAYNFRGTCTGPISFFSVGRQMNRYNYDVVDEYRYWDDIVISTSYIGP
ncbi:MAG: putative Ig domain-containing protein [Terriglobia bacterium]